MDDTDLLNSILGITSGSPFDSNAGVNLASGQATSPVITNSNGTSSPSPSFLSQLGSFLQGASNIAAPILPAVLGTAPSTTAHPAGTTGAASVASSLLSSPITLIGIVGGVVLLILLLKK